MKEITTMKEKKSMVKPILLCAACILGVHIAGIIIQSVIGAAGNIAFGDSQSSGSFLITIIVGLAVNIPAGIISASIAYKIGDKNDCLCKRFYIWSFVAFFIIMLVLSAVLASALGTSIAGSNIVNIIFIIAYFAKMNSDLKGITPSSDSQKDPVPQKEPIGTPETIVSEPPAAAEPAINMEEKPAEIAPEAETIIEEPKTVAASNPEKKILFCSQCGARLVDGGAFCPFCGAKAK